MEAQEEMKFNSLKEAAQFRIHENEDNYWEVAYWEAAVDAALQSVPNTIHYLQRDCTDEEFFWLSEIFEELVKKTQSVELLEALRTRLKQVTLESYHQQDFESDFMRKYVDYNEYVSSIAKEIDYADGQLEY